MRIPDQKPALTSIRMIAASMLRNALIRRLLQTYQGQYPYLPFPLKELIDGKPCIVASSVQMPPQEQRKAGCGSRRLMHFWIMRKSVVSPNVYDAEVIITASTFTNARW